jgi:hypothetical protein
MANANITQNFNLILPAGTQIVTKIEVKWKREALKPIHTKQGFQRLSDILQIFIKSQ